MRVTALELAKRLREEQESQHRWAEQHFDTLDDGHFMAVAMNDKECVLSPYPEFAGLIYRGQKQYYEPCLSSLYRTSRSKIDRLLARIRVAEFQLLLFDHPAVVDFSDWSVMGLRFRIDYEGLAQHYGLETELIDFTSNPFVAAFFACCEYDNDSHEYRPIMRAGQEGIIYTYLADADIADAAGPEQPHSSAVGLQPLPRPAEQYAWCYRLPKRASLNSRRFVSSFPFIHDPKVSIKIFEHFEGGTKLFPYDPVSEKAREIASTKKLSRSAFYLAMARYGQRMREQSTLNALSRKGIEIVDDREIVFTEAEKAKTEKEWNERRPDLISRINWRKACYPE
jgi:hypothetical protein